MSNHGIRCPQVGGGNGAEVSGIAGADHLLIGYGGWEAGGDAWGPEPSEGEVLAAMRAGFDAVSTGSTQQRSMAAVGRSP